MKNVIVTAIVQGVAAALVTYLLTSAETVVGEIAYEYGEASYNNIKADIVDIEKKIQAGEYGKAGYLDQVEDRKRVLQEALEPSESAINNYLFLFVRILGVLFLTTILSVGFVGAIGAGLGKTQESLPVTKGTFLLVGLILIPFMFVTLLRAESEIFFAKIYIMSEVETKEIGSLEPDDF